MVQIIAKFAFADGAGGRNLQILADLGTSGECKQNVWRDLLRKVKVGFVDAARVLVSIPLQIAAVVVPRKVSMLLPHKLSHVMFAHHRASLYIDCVGEL